MVKISPNDNSPLIQPLPLPSLQLHLLVHLWRQGSIIIDNEYDDKYDDNHVDNHDDNNDDNHVSLDTGEWRKYIYWYTCGAKFLSSITITEMGLVIMALVENVEKEHDDEETS